MMKISSFLLKNYKNFNFSHKNRWKSLKIRSQFTSIPFLISRWTIFLFKNQFFVFFIQKCVIFRFSELLLTHTALLCLFLIFFCIFWVFQSILCENSEFLVSKMCILHFFFILSWKIQFLREKHAFSIWKLNFHL